MPLFSPPVSAGTLDFWGRGYLNGGESAGEDSHAIPFIYADNCGRLFIEILNSNDKYILCKGRIFSIFVANKISLQMFYSYSHFYLKSDLGRR